MGDRKLRVGFVGLGIMGASMARNVLKAGFPLTVYNRTRSREKPLLEAGARAGGSPAEVARASDIVLTCVSDTPDVREVVLGESGALKGAVPGTVIADMSTISPAAAREIAARCAKKGVDFLDAPVSGGDKGAREGTLSIMVGGSEEAFKRALPVFEAMGKTITRIGGSGAGQVAKLVNQVICAGNLLGCAEGLALAEASGVDPRGILAAVSQGAARSWILENLGPKMLSGDFAPGFFVRLKQKDLRLAQELGSETGASLPGTALVQQLYRGIEASGGGELGTQSLIVALRRLAGRK